MRSKVACSSEANEDVDEAHRAEKHTPTTIPLRRRLQNCLAWGWTSPSAVSFLLSQGAMVNSITRAFWLLGW